MTEVKQLEKTSQNPIESAVNQLKEAAAKDLNNKIKEKVKAALDAKRAFDTLCLELKELLKEKEVESIEFNELAKSLK